jgi:hypothetical protein
MLADALNQAWDERRKSAAIEAVMRFSPEGLVLGAGTLLAAAGESARDVSVNPVEPRLTALLTAAHLRRPTAQALTHLRKATECWRTGDDALAAMHLVLSQVDRLRQPDSDAHRLFLADGLLKNGADAGAIVDALESGGAAFDELRKRYNPDEPRVPAGNGLTSGRWTTSDGSPQSPSAEVNPETVTPVGNTKGSYQGPDACYRAKKDCQINVRQASAADPSHDIRYFGFFNQRSQAEGACLLIDFGVDQAHVLRQGGVLYPDGGVVIINKGQEPIYYPREIAALKWPRRTTPF